MRALHRNAAATAVLVALVAWTIAGCGKSGKPTSVETNTPGTSGGAG